MADATTHSESGDRDAVRSQFKRLGFDDKIVAQAIAAYKTADQAQRWIEVFGPYALRSEYFHEISTSKLSLEEYEQWRDAGVDGLAGLRLARRLKAKGILAEDYVSWTAAGLESIEQLLPHLNTQFSIADALALLDMWEQPGAEGATDSTSELAALLKQGLAIDELRVLLASGVRGHDVYAWYGTPIPHEAWKEWIDRGISRAAAEIYWRGDIPAGSAKEWHQAGVQASAAVELVSLGMSLQTVRNWLSLGISGAEVAGFSGLSVSIETAREWLTRGVSASDALYFLANGVSLDVACEAVAGGLNARDAVDYMENGASLEQAINLSKRGIDAHQLNPVDGGFTLDLDPWQVDPADHMPEVIEPGRIDVTVWLSVFGEEPPVAYDVSFDWDGDHTAGWTEDISILNNLSFASGSPARGVLSWSNDHEVVLTYSWPEFDLCGYTTMSVGAADKGAVSRGAADPRHWVHWAERLVEFVMTDLGSSRERNDVLAEWYIDTRDGSEVDVHELFRQYLASGPPEDSRREFPGWLAESIKVGTYQLEDGPFD
ncbi:hypothetical protein ACAG25_07740 [Mycobacterium sp. pV006]|uniref:hypothetical protein n=1 Tax=Mycobacterium sp. pV006 TaxID=3238983 RepID=UPI00351B3D5D